MDNIAKLWYIIHTEKETHDRPSEQKRHSLTT
jgi:hypothetical protein